MVRFGRTEEEKKALWDQGFLPVYSVDTEDEARELLAFACETNKGGDFVARELAEAQDLEKLYAFGDRLRMMHESMRENDAKG